MDISGFKISQAILQVKFKPAFSLWDKAGAIGDRFRLLYPTLTLGQVQPGSVQFNVERVLQFTVELERLHVACLSPKALLPDASDICEKAWNCFMQILEVPVLEQVSTRVIFFKDTKAAIDGAAALLRTGILKVPQPIFEHNNPPSAMDFTIKWDTDEIATILKMRQESVKVEFTPPADYPDFEPINRESFRLIYDIDRVTKAPMEIGKFRVVEWFKSFDHLIKRDSKAIVGGI